jgi:hypothetical protein
MALAKNLTVTYHAHGHVKDIKVLTEGIDQNVKAVKERTPWFHTSFHARTNPISYRVPIQEMKSNNVCNSSMTSSLAIRADMHPQGIGCKRNSEDGSLLQTLPPIITLHTRFSMTVPQDGSFKAANSENGK